MRDALPVRCEAISASTGKAALVACDEFKFGGHVRRLARCAQGLVVVKRWRKIYLTSFLLRFLTSLLISSSDGDAADFLFDIVFSRTLLHLLPDFRNFNSPLTNNEPKAGHTT
jgi:hypothetical protein